MENSEHAWDCLVHCSRGDALFASGEVAEAEADYQKALAWSRERSAKWAELYAGVRLARLWRSDGRAERVRELLTPIYGWFTEGFDNAVLQAAKALLDESPSPRR
jgi:predicted ATPase